MQRTLRVSAEDGRLSSQQSELRTSEFITSESNTREVTDKATDKKPTGCAQEQFTGPSLIPEGSLEPLTGPDDTKPHSNAIGGSPVAPPSFPASLPGVDAEQLQAAKSQAAFREDHQELIVWLNHAARRADEQHKDFNFPSGLLNRINEHGSLTKKQIAAAEKLMAEDATFQRVKTESVPLPTYADVLEQQQQAPDQDDDSIFSSDGEWYRRDPNGFHGPFKSQQEAKEFRINNVGAEYNNFALAVEAVCF